MYYQVIIEVKNPKGSNLKYFELDKESQEEILDDIVIPFLLKKDFQFDGYFLNPSNIIRIVVKATKKSVRELSDYENDHMPTGLIMYVSPKDILDYDKHTEDVTKKIFELANENIKRGDIKLDAEENVELDKTKVFIVHGHDDLAKVEAARFIEQLGFESIILHEQANSGKTIIEKIEAYSNVGFGVVLYTPCDVGAIHKDQTNLKARARQNVIFEHGFLIGKIGRANVCALVKGDVEIPNDISGVVYIPMDNSRAWHVAVAKELRNSGYNVDMNLVV
ncbi:MAG: nucleotide-binding protein [Paenibacillaceae bacterium]